MLRSQHLIFQLLFLAIFITATVIYWPGLNGPFLFDDFANLKAVGDYGGVRNWETFQLFVLGNTSGPTGRPVSMLSFLLNATDWPANAWSFKFTNLLIHLGNGILIFLIVTTIYRLSQPGNDKAYWVAILTMAYWLLHPFNVSTVLYPVQRMAMLAAFFVFMGLLGYIKGRQLLCTNRIMAYSWMSIALVFGTILAGLSKENGALLPILVLCLEITIFRSVNPRPNRHWVFIFLWTPLILITGYFLYGLFSGNLQASYSHRPFTMIERALTQPRVLLDYLYYWFIPHITSPGLLTQNFPISKTLWEPFTTIPAILIIIVLILSAIWLRQKFPLYSLAILFYFSGHALESTLISLEIYFEHRNYLPTVFLFTPIAAGFISYFKDTRLRISFIILVILVTSFLTAVRAEIWSSEESLAYHWAEIHPTSQRAMRHAALVAEKHGKYGLALHYISKAKENMNDKVAVQIHWLTLNCRMRPILDTEKKEILRIMREGYFSFRSYNLIRSNLEFIASGHCLNLGREFAYELIHALRNNDRAKKSGGARYQLQMIEGTLKLKENDYLAAADHFKNSLKEYPHIDGAMIQVGMLATAHQYQLALDHIDFIEHNLKSKIKTKMGGLDYESELFRLKEVITEDLNNVK